MWDRAVLFEHGPSTFVIATEEYSRREGGGHDFRVVHLTLLMVLMAYRFSQIVAQTVRRYNFVVHGLAPPEVKRVISPSM